MPGPPPQQMTSPGLASPSQTAAAGHTVALGPQVQGDPAAPPVRALLERYFTAINQHDYAAYRRLLDPAYDRALAGRAGQSPQSQFDSGYTTTHDSAETLTGISETGGRVLAATVSFTSHQNPGESVNNSSCTLWTITLYLKPQGSGYLIGAPPTGYQPTHEDCP